MFLSREIYSKENTQRISKSNYQSFTRNSLRDMNLSKSSPHLMVVKKTKSKILTNLKVNFIGNLNEFLIKFVKF